MTIRTATSPSGAPDDTPSVGVRGRFPVGSAWAEAIVVTIGGGLLAAALGIRNGEFNLVGYLLRGMHGADRSVLRGDWRTEDTKQFHVAWNQLVEWSARAGRLDVVLTAGALLCGVALSAGLYLLAKAVYEQPLLPWLAALVLLGGCYTRSLGDFYLLPPTFEPFGIGGAALVCGLAALAWRRPLAAGLAFGVCAFWHLQLGTLAGAILAGATIRGWSELGARGAVRLWAPYLVLGVPNMVLAVRLTRSEGSEEASAILRSVARQQYEPWSHDHRVLLAFAAACAFGAVGLLLHPASLSRLVQGAVVAAIAAVVVSVVIGAIADVDLVIRALPWRIASLVAAVMFLFGSAGLLGSAPARDTSFSHRRVWLVAISCASLSIVGLAEQTRMRVAVVAVLAAAVAQHLARRQRLAPSHIAARIAAGTMALALLVMAASGLSHSHTGLQSPAGDRVAVYDYARQTPPGTVFAVPLDFADFRLLTERAIVVDWASPPLYNPDVLDWRDRLLAVSGAPELTSFDELEAGFEAPSCDRLQRLAADYGMDYFVSRVRPVLACTEEVFDGGAYVVTRLRT